MLALATECRSEAPDNDDRHGLAGVLERRDVGAHPPGPERPLWLGAKPSELSRPTAGPRRSLPLPETMLPSVIVRLPGGESNPGVRSVGMDEASLELMWAERACERLVYRYAWLVDSGEAAGIADLFTEDGVWLAGDSEPMRGRDGIRSGFSARQAVTHRQSRHVMTNVMIDVDGDTATGRVYLVNYRHDSGTGVAALPAPSDSPKFVGDYGLTFRCVDGEWLFVTLELDFAFLRQRTPS